MIDKTYRPADVEGRIYAMWEEAGAFRAGRPERRDAEPYSMVIPPPNVTGSLHMGHALNNTLQDLLCRFERMRGKDVLWQPGTDHAGIATQMVVERQLMERQRPGRREMGREAFVQRVWEWKAESGGAIIRQLKRLGASCDWSRERFTMDEGLSRAVLKVFVDLYRAGLIYKDKRLVNWDPKLLTAISDLEVQQVEVKGHLWHIRYPLEGKSFDPSDASTYIVVATTRPETMLGDTAVAVHPENERLKHLIGQHVILPLVGRRIPIIGDDYADPEKGTGAVKITPAHDFNDFEVGKRHDLPLVSVLTKEGKIKSSFWDDFDFPRHEGTVLAEEPIIGASVSEQIPSELHGLDRFAARKKVIEMLEAKDLMDKIEPHTHTVPHGDRSGAVVEPFLTDQWYVDAKTLSLPAIAAMREGRTAFVPKNWEKTYFDWMENIQPWCVSRQLWWGHQIPAWYGPKLERGKLKWPLEWQIFVAETAKEAAAQAEAYYHCRVNAANTLTNEPAVEWEKLAKGADTTLPPEMTILRDEDVLDTWFSSALWPFSTLGWPDDTPELKRYYPTSVLSTAFDIIFFWVARMMMMGLHFMKDVPFRTVYIHALIRDERGQKMSKSKGNIVDPLELIDQYGADAVRFTMAAMAAQGRDIKVSLNRVEGYRNFATKLWNAARFVEFNGAARDPNFDPHSTKEVLNRWIAHETAKAVREVTAAIEAFKFNDAAAAAYRFVWNVYCDWYVELSKPVLTGPDTPARAETRAAAAWALDEILKLLHPFMPFITEELWQVTASLVIPDAAQRPSVPNNSEAGTLSPPSPLAGEGREGGVRTTLLALTPWPHLEGLDDPAAEAEIGWVIDLITAVRSVATEMKLPAGTQIPLMLVNASPESRARAERWAEFIKRLARLSDIGFADAAPAGSAQLLVRGEIAALPLKGLIDVSAEHARLEKEMAKVANDITRIDAKLGNADFIKRAPEEVIDGEREKRDEAEARRQKIMEALERLKGAA